MGLISVIATLSQAAAASPPPADSYEWLNGANMVYDGDSKTKNDSCTYPYTTLIMGLTPFAGRGITMHNLGRNGVPISQMVTDGASRVDTLLVPGVINICVYQDLTNELSSGFVTARAAVDNYWIYAADRYAAGWDYVIAQGDTYWNGVGAGFNTLEEEANALLLAEHSAHVDGFVDWFNEPLLNPYTHPENFLDNGGTRYHPNDGGCPVIASLNKPVILALQ